VIDILRAEIHRNLALMGASDVRRLTVDAVVV